MKLFSRKFALDDIEMRITASSDGAYVKNGKVYLKQKSNIYVDVAYEELVEKLEIWSFHVTSREYDGEPNGLNFEQIFLPEAFSYQFAARLLDVKEKFKQHRSDEVFIKDVFIKSADLLDDKIQLRILQMESWKEKE